MTNKLGPEVLAELKAAEAEATPGPWVHDTVQGESAVICGGPFGLVVKWNRSERAFADCALIALLRNHAPALLASARRLGKVTQALNVSLAATEMAEHANDACEEQLTAANARVVALTHRTEELTDALHRDQTGLAAALGRVVESVKGRMWVTEGRGAYEWDDDRYKEEAGAALRETMGIALQALRDSGTIANKALNGKEPKPEGERDRAYIVTLTAERDAAIQRAEAAEAARDALAAKLAEVEKALRQIADGDALSDAADEVERGDHMKERTDG